MAQIIDLKGQRFSSWLVISYSLTRKYYWLCKCDCGKEKEVCSKILKTGNSTSCGCSRRKQLPEEKEMSNILTNMKNRCYNINNPGYYNYGGRGIKVCERWLEPDGKGLKNFIEDMGFRPSKEYSIDREENDEGYYKENCRWATDKEQAANKRKFKKLTKEQVNEIKNSSDRAYLLANKYNVTSTFIRDIKYPNKKGYTDKFRNTEAILTDEQVKSIKIFIRDKESNFKSKEDLRRTIALEFNIPVSVIRHIYYNETYKDVLID